MNKKIDDDRSAWLEDIATLVPVRFVLSLKPQGMVHPSKASAGQSRQSPAAKQASRNEGKT